MQKLFKTLSTIGVILALVGALLLIDVFITMNNILEINDRTFIDLKRGATIKTLANDLKKKNLLDRPQYLVAWARIQGITTQLKAGEYSIHPGESLIDLLDKMVAGKVEQYKLTLVEGWNFKEMMNAINQHPQVIHTFAGKSEKQIMQAINLAGVHHEGRFYPDTYYINKQTNDSEILKRAFSSMTDVLEEKWKTRDVKLPLSSPYEALILASIVEKESAVANERAKIAGVFINRLKIKMRLQTDPTVIYGMGDLYKGDIRYRDLRKDTPYNTYTRRGLPPTPIAMPGAAAIDAVMHPEKTDALYFVAYGDGSGRHYFSSNLKDHENAVNQYQRNR